MDSQKRPTTLAWIQVSSCFEFIFLTVLLRYSASLCPPPLEPDQPSSADQEFLLRPQAEPVQRWRSSPHHQPPDVPAHPCVHRRDARLLLRLPHHRPAPRRIIYHLPNKVLRGQGVQEVEAWSKANPFPHLGDLPNHNAPLQGQGVRGVQGERQAGGLCYPPQKTRIRCNKLFKTYQRSCNSRSPESRGTWR